MTDEPTFSIRIDNRLDDYAPLFDQRWADQITNLAADTRKLLDGLKGRALRLVKKAVTLPNVR